MPSPPDLPSHVQRIVDEIENEIGEDPARPAALIEGNGTGSHASNDRVEAAVREILLDAVTHLPAADARPCECGHALDGLQLPFALP